MELSTISMNSSTTEQCLEPTKNKKIYYSSQKYRSITKKKKKITPFQRPNQPNPGHKMP